MDTQPSPSLQPQDPVPTNVQPTAPASPATPPVTPAPAPTQSPATPDVSSGRVLPSTTNPFVLLWEGFKNLGQNIGTLVLLVLLSIALAIPAIVVVIVYFASHSIVTTSILAVIVGLAMIYFYCVLDAAYVRLFLANTRGQKVSFGELWAFGRTRWLTLLGAGILTYLILVVGLILLVVPGIIAATILVFTLYVVADDSPVGVTESLGKSRDLTKGHRWSIFFLFLAYGVIAIVLGFIPLIGSILSALVEFGLFGAVAIRYQQLLSAPAVPQTPSTPQPAPVPAA